MNYVVFKRFGKEAHFNERPNSQNDSIDKFCKENNIRPRATVSAICSADEVFSSPGWERLEEFAKSGRNMKIIVADGDRLCRDVVTFLKKEAELKKQGIRFVFVTNAKMNLGKGLKKNRGRGV